MLDRERLTVAIEIHSRCFQLLRWLRDAVDEGVLPLEPLLGKHSDSPDAAVAWFEMNYPMFPQEAQPDREHIREYASYFWTYITTSFDVVSQPGTRIDRDDYLRVRNVSHLQAKTPTRADKRRAVELMAERIASLASEEGLAASAERIAGMLEQVDTRRAAGYSAYGFWLIERLSGRTEGLPVLALWREIAWNRSGSPIQGFRLCYKDFDAAENLLIEALRS